MLKFLISFIRKSYKLLSTLIFVIIFFVIYNTYLVDRSLINLRIALERTAQAQTIDDFAKIKPLLKVPLVKEISKSTVSSKALVPLELAENIITTAKSTEQIEDVKFYLKSIILVKEKERGRFLSALDRLNVRLFKPEVKITEKRLLAQKEVLLAKIKYTEDKTTLQQLHFDVGNIYVQLQDTAKAEEAFLKVSQIDPHTDIAMKAIFNLAWGYKSSGEYDKAITYFEKVKQLYAKAKISIDSGYQVADTHFKKGEYQKAQETYAQLSSEYPEFDLADLALYEAGYLSFYYLDDREAALSYFAKLEEKYPKAKVVQHVNKQIRPTMAGDLRLQGFILLKEKRFIEAIENFREAVEIAPSDGRSFSGMGLGFYWLDNKPEALDKAGKATRASSDDVVTIINAMFVYINSLNFDGAIKLGEEFLSKRKTVTRAEFYYNLGYAYVLKAMINEARTCFDKAIRLNQDFVFAYNNLGCTLWSMGNYSDAIKRFQEAIARDPDYADAYFNLGVAHFYLNCLEDAYRQFELVLDVKPDYQEAKIYLERIKEILRYVP